MEQRNPNFFARIHKFASYEVGGRHPPLSGNMASPRLGAPHLNYSGVRNWMVDEDSSNDKESSSDFELSLPSPSIMPFCKSDVGLVIKFIDAVAIFVEMKFSSRSVIHNRKVKTHGLSIFFMEILWSPLFWSLQNFLGFFGRILNVCAIETVFFHWAPVSSNEANLQWQPFEKACDLWLPARLHCRNKSHWYAICMCLLFVSMLKNDAFYTFFHKKN